MSTFFGGQGVFPTIGGAPSNTISRFRPGRSGSLPSGWWEVKPGPYSVLERKERITGIWRKVGAGSLTGSNDRFRSDGVNYRVANQSGCAVGVVVTTAGSAITTAPTVTASAGGSVWQAIVGGSISATVTVTNGGSGYTYPPLVSFSLPPTPGFPASGYATLSAGAVSTITVVDRGAGYNAPPIVSLQNDPREGLNGTTVGINAAAVASLTGGGTITGLVCLDHGTPVTSVPTFTWSPSGPAATCVMCWSITAYVVSATTAGSGYTTPVIISAYDTPISGSVIVNPTMQNALVAERRAFIVGALSAGAFTATGQTVLDGGIYTQVPTTYVVSSNVARTNPVAGVFLSPTMGGQNDVTLIFPG